jgi:hypothetical protein
MTTKPSITATKMTGYKDKKLHVTMGDFEGTIGQKRFKLSTRGPVPVVI